MNTLPLVSSLPLARHGDPCPEGGGQSSSSWSTEGRLRGRKQGKVEPDLEGQAKEETIVIMTATSHPDPKGRAVAPLSPGMWKLKPRRPGWTPACQRALGVLPPVSIMTMTMLASVYTYSVSIITWASTRFSRKPPFAFFPMVPDHHGIKHRKEGLHLQEGVQEHRGEGCSPFSSRQYNDG